MKVKFRKCWDCKSCTANKKKILHVNEWEGRRKCRIANPAQRGDLIAYDSVGIFASNQCGNSDTIYIPARHCDSVQARLRSNTKSNTAIAGSIKMFPNPTSGKVKMLYQLNSEKGMLVLVNMLGEKIKTFVIDSKSRTFEFDLSDYDGGLLEWRVLDNESLIGRGSLVIIK